MFQTFANAGAWKGRLFQDITGITSAKDVLVVPLLPAHP